MVFAHRNGIITINFEIEYLKKIKIKWNFSNSMLSYRGLNEPDLCVCRLVDQYEEASVHLWDLMEGKDKAVAGTTCESKLKLQQSDTVPLILFIVLVSAQVQTRQQFLLEAWLHWSAQLAVRAVGRRLSSHGV